MIHDFFEEASWALQGWSNLKTNPMPDLKDTPDASGEFAGIEAEHGIWAGGVASVYRHLSKVVRQHNCPFAPSVQRNNAAYVHIDSSSENPQSISAAIRESVLLMATEFFKISAQETAKGQSHDFTTLFLVFMGFSDNVVLSPEFSADFSKARAFYAPIALSCGLTLADSGPGHPDEERDGRNVTPYPTLIMHRLHEEDRAFMQSPAAKEIFRRFFSD